MTQVARTQLARDLYLERCWPGSGQRQRFAFVRLVEADEVNAKEVR